MTNVDQFESMFRAAAREPFKREKAEIESVLVITDLDETGAKQFSQQTQEFLKIIKCAQWRIVDGSEFKTAGELLTLVESVAPDMICTYRNLHSIAWKWPYSLGTHVDLLTQHTDIPVLLLPHPEAKRSAVHAIENTNKVMAIADHLTGDDRLVNYALQFTESGGTLWLSHVEDEATFGRYIEIISKIPTIDTDEARTTVRDQLLKEPADYIASCIDVLGETGTAIKIEQLIVFGHHLSEYKRLIEEHEVDLLVLNTKDDNQLAMHGMAYALAVELRQIPLLML